MKIRFFALIGVIAIAIAGYLAFTVFDAETPVATAAKKMYSGTVYVAGMGGHFAAADLTIDPNDAEHPIKVSGLNKVDIGDKKTHPTHDARIDCNDKNTMFWSTYKLDPEGNVHVGKSDLKTGKVEKDVALKLDERAKWTGALYCGSGQTKTTFIPVTMTDEAYIDVFDKKTLELKHRVFLDELGYKGNYKFFHGTNSNDFKKFAVAINKTTDGKLDGNIDVVMLDLPSLEKGKVKVLGKTTVTGQPGKTITFRQYFSHDDKYLFQSAGDRFLLLDAKTLKLLDEEMLPGENHDAIGTADSKYVLLTLRESIKNKEGKEIKDGTLQLYDMETKKLFGKSSSACYACHGNIGIEGNAILCGLDANWK